MARTRRRDHAWNPPATGTDVSALFAVLVAVPLLLPALGGAEQLAFALPVVVLAVAVYRCLQAAARSAARRPVWRAFAIACALALAGSALALAAALVDASATAGFYIGAGGSVALLVAGTLAATRSLRASEVSRLLDGLLFCALIVAHGVWFVALPGFEHGDPVLTGVFVIDLAALVLVMLATIARRNPRVRRIGAGMVVVCGAAAGGDALIATSAAGTLEASSVVIAALWALAGAGAIAAARVELSGVDESEPFEAFSGSRWLYARVALPLFALGALVAIPAAARTDGGVYYGVFFVAMLVLAFARQAYLVVENGRTMTRERTLRREVMRRNADLEALTGLATTMTETLEEAPIVERGVDVLRLAGRATSAALHVGESLELRATAGEWPTERVWVGAPALVSEVEVRARGGREVVRLPVRAHGVDVGVATLVRPGTAPFERDELELLRLLAEQLGIALRNAREYLERLEQAIRDPLTGLYNRRFFYEALEKEISRSARYETPASLVLFDVDDFKAINDSLGHAAGDEVLRDLARFVDERIRPSDTFGRIGGEEFGLLLPETDSLEALLIAERLRRAIAGASFLADRQVTVSGGVASCPHDGRNADVLQQKADGALYWSKHNGRNICAVAGEVVVLNVDEGSAESPMVAHLHALVTAIDAQHLQTRDHSENVAAYAMAIGQALGFDADKMVRLHRAALLHDIGKLAVRQEVLVKSGRLTDEEYAEIQLHSKVGASMLLHAGLVDEARWVRHHHERMDGRGYPDGLAGHDIPFESRIIFVADSLEAMTSDRPYRNGMPVEDALAELRRCAGTQFDADIVSILGRLIESDRLTVVALRQ